MKNMTAAEIAAMPVSDRIQLAEDLWDSIAECPEAIELPDWHKQELNSRLEAYHADPEAGSPAASSWAEVKRRIRG